MKHRSKICSLFIYGIVFVTLILDMNSCKLFTEPEPFVNRDAHPMTTQEGVFNNYSVDQIVTGNINLSFVPKLNPSDIALIKLYMDTTFLTYFKLSPYEFVLNTSNFPNGKYPFNIFVYLKPKGSDSLGMLNLLGMPSQFYQTSLIFDNADAPPIAPANIALSYQNRFTNISWTPINQKYFYCYLIRKDGEIIDSIYSQTVSTYVDSTLPDYCKGYYEVGISTGKKEAYSLQAAYQKGEKLSLENVTASIDNLNDQVIFAHSNLLTSISTITARKINECNSGSGGLLATNPNKDTLYYCQQLVGGGTLFTYEVKTLKEFNRRQIHILSGSWYDAFPGAIAIGPGSQFYASALDYGTLFILNKNDTCFYVDGDDSPQSYQGNPIPTFHGPAQYLSISPDGSTLLAVDWDGLRCFTIDGRSFQPSFTIPNVDLVRVDWPNSRIFSTQTGLYGTVVEAWNMQTFSLMYSYQLTTYTSSDITALFYNTKSLFVAYIINFYNSNATLLAEYDINTQQLTHTWTLQSIVQSLLGSDNGRYLFACPATEQWIVDIGGTP